MFNLILVVIPSLVLGTDQLAEQHSTLSHCYKEECKGMPTETLTQRKKVMDCHKGCFDKYAPDSWEGTVFCRDKPAVKGLSSVNIKGNSQRYFKPPTDFSCKQDCVERFNKPAKEIGARDEVGRYCVPKGGVQKLSGFKKDDPAKGIYVESRGNCSAFCAS